ncbi:uroporphyrin-III C-methyltransferase [Rickenella mellea]|uniref:precorrin-2 dehydrogenase n=1 Tax=Rickenella mellea TaxID=50990 RepID=A0A4Y7QG77_9AGAM|nr:uroporphyrin-III C-methyltransferase [Rickenella mellea]
MAFPEPRKGASMMLAFKFHSNKTTLIIGGNTLAASRALTALEAGSRAVVLARGGLDVVCDELKWRASQRQLEVVDLAKITVPSSTSTDDSDEVALRSFLNDHGPVSLVCVTDTLTGPDFSLRRHRASARAIYKICSQHNIPVNTADMPDCCDFTFTASHRFSDPSNGCPTPLQIAVTTNGTGCRLSGRIKREIIANVPKDAGVAVQKIGLFREIAKESPFNEEEIHDFNDELTEPTPNRPVRQRCFNSSETEAEAARRRMKWIAQISEYWPISRLANITENEMTDILRHDISPHNYAKDVDLIPDTSFSQHSLTLTTPPRKGRIFLVGSGPGHPSLLTLATHKILTREADLVLSDKLVPAAVLSLIPDTVETRIARKFPGNAEGAQSEMMEAAVEAAKRGLTVVRLKQGDPIVYGRAGEEILYFRQHGFEAVVVPGVSSALAAPMFAGIPVTQRGVSESFIVCTGVGRKGKEVRLPGYERSRTLVILMGVARLPQILEALIDSSPLDDGMTRRRDGNSYPPHMPIALIERASMPDQRVIMSTLSHIAEALDRAGEQRPPGLLVVGWAVLALWGPGDAQVLEEGEDSEKDRERVQRWMDGGRWRVSEGLHESWGDV